MTRDYLISAVFWIALLAALGQAVRPLINRLVERRD